MSENLLDKIKRLDAQRTMVDGTPTTRKPSLKSEWLPVCEPFTAGATGKSCCTSVSASRQRAEPAGAPVKVPV